MNERRRAKLDGGRSELSAAEGGTISGRRPVIAPPQHCDECGFAAVARGGPDVATAIGSLGEPYQVPLTTGDPSVRRRPDEKAWSILEYGAHVRDVVAIWGWTLNQALSLDRPVFPLPDPDIADRTAAEASYGNQDPAIVARELKANAERAAAKFSAADPDGWSRSVLFGDEELTVLDIANKLLHEGHHHLYDIERISSQWQ